MCGLVGLYDPGHDPRIMDAMTETMLHRGPDGGGSWRSTVHPVSLGHRRLAIIDTSENGYQPMVFPEAALAMVYNGELYNTESLRDRLLAEGCTFRGHSDTEVLLRGFERWGLDVLQRINGMFAFAILDEREGRIILARDRCGQKPLYFTQSEQGFAFASEIKALRVWRPDLSEIDPAAMGDYLAYGYAMDDRTLTAGVRKLQPGEFAVYDIAKRQLDIKTYWSLPEPDQTRLGEAEAEEQFEAMLADSVDRHMIADVPVGVLLSGGIDSSLITALAARSGRHLRTFSVTFPGQGDFDEAGYARQVAEHFGSEHTTLEMESFDFDTVEALTRQFDDPIADHAIIPTYLLSRRIREHVTVALGGDGGDELFGGYPHYGVIGWQARLRRVPGFVRNMVARRAARLPAGMRGRNHLAGMGGDLGEAIARINLHFDAEQRARLLGTAVSDRPEREKAILSEMPQRGPVERAMASDFRSTMAEGYLAKIDRASMLASLEVRAPFLDDALVDFAWRSVPTSVKFHDGRDKILPRRLAAKLLPTDVASKKKRGLTMPIGSWIKSGSVGFLRDVLLDSSQSLFDRREVERLFTLQEEGRRNDGRLMSLLFLTLWARHYGMERGGADADRA